MWLLPVYVRVSRGLFFLGLRKYYWKYFQIRGKAKILRNITILSNRNALFAVPFSHVCFRCLRALQRSASTKRLKNDKMLAVAWNVIRSILVSSYCIIPHIVSCNCVCAKVSCKEMANSLWLCDGSGRYDTCSVLIPMCGVPLNHESNIFITFFKMSGGLTRFT
jgi:hypothetical protein